MKKHILAQGKRTKVFLACNLSKSDSRSGVYMRINEHRRIPFNNDCTKKTLALLPCILALMLIVSMHTLANSAEPYPVLPASLTVDYQNINLKQIGRIDLGIAGTHLLVQPFSSPLYVGGAVYGAVQGVYSGFFALGAEVGVRFPISKYLEWEAGGMIGAGGGQGTAAFTGEGQMLQYHTGLNFVSKKVKLGVAYSNLRFLNTTIVSESVLLSAHLPFDFQFYPFNNRKLDLPKTDAKKYVALVASSYHPYADVTNVYGTPDTESTKFIGVELAYELAKQVFGLINFKGSMYGHKHGYADFFLGVALKQPLIENKLNILSKLNIGTGGGGGVDTGTGLLYYPQIGMEYFITNNIGAEFDVGVVRSTEKNYRANALNAQLNYYLNEDAKQTPYRFGMRFGHQTYLNPTKTHTNNAPSIDLISVKLDGYMTQNMYMTGQMAFAYTGNVAGYFSGLLGLGINQPIYQEAPLGVIAEMMVGAAGGAGLDLGQGLIIAPNVGLNYQVNEYASLYGLAGKTKPVKGKFDAWTVEAGLKYRFSLYL